MNTGITREPAVSESGVTLELPKAILMAIRIAGVYDEISIDPTSGKVLARIHLTGRYDSYSDTYELNGGRWKIEGHKSWPNGEDTYTMKLEKHYVRSHR